MSAFPNVSVRNVAGLNIPQHDAVSITYHGSTNNIATVIYKTGGAAGTAVATLTLAYDGGVPASDDARLLTVTRT
jgi:hypothetical protein